MKTKKRKIRADKLLILNGITDNIIEAKKIILSGMARIGKDHLIKNPAEMFPEDTILNIDDNNKYVSRGALKILPAIKKYTPVLNGKTGLDIGASTGGFTDVMLELGAEKVYAVDSGTGQLHYKLRTDNRVISMEKTNARNFNKNSIPEKADIFTMDVSFISVKKIIPAITELFSENAFGYILVKPQFELPKNLVEKGGVIKSEELRQKAVNDVREFIETETSWILKEIISSPIKGPKGNQEYIMCIAINSK